MNLVSRFVCEISGDNILLISLLVGFHLLTLSFEPPKTTIFCKMVQMD